MAVNETPEGAIALEGACPLEDAEKLLQQLIARPTAVVDWRQCTGAHTALIQVILAARPALRGPPRSEWLRVFIDPLLRSERPGTVAREARG